MHKKTLFLSPVAITLLGMALPLVAAAQVPEVGGIFDQIQKLFNYALILIFAIAAIYFLWGVVGYISTSGDEASRKKAKEHMIYGLVAIAVMLTFWGLILVVTNYFGLNQRAAPNLPSLPRPSNVTQ